MNVATSDWTKLGLIGGGGDLPVRIAEVCRDSGKPVHVIRLRSYADPRLQAFSGDECGIAEVGKLIGLLKENECDAVLLAGIVTRPNFSALRPDFRGAKLLPKVLAAAGKGDDALLSVIVAEFEADGFTVLGADDIVTDLVAVSGAYGAYTPQKEHFADMAKARALVSAIGPFDVGQGAVVCDGLVLAVEAAEGTDAMLSRCADLSGELRGDAEARRGVLLKTPKPGQERRVDLPTIGVSTIERAAAAGLAGVAVAAGAALVMDRDGVAEAADAHGLFVYGFHADELDGVDEEPAPH